MCGLWCRGALCCGFDLEVLQHVSGVCRGSTEQHLVLSTVRGLTEANVDVTGLKCNRA